MAHRSVAVVLAACLLLAACASAGPAVEPDPASPAVTPEMVLDRAQGVADRLESREAEMEALLP